MTREKVDSETPKLRKVRKPAAIFREESSKSSTRDEIRQRIQQAKEQGEDITKTPARVHGCTRCLHCDGKCLI